MKKKLVVRGLGPLPSAENKSVALGKRNWPREKRNEKDQKNLERDGRKFF